MKKQLTIAAVLGVAAFIGFSYFAHADMAAPAAVDAYAADHDACMKSASVGTPAPAADAVKAAYTKCMTDKKHTADEMKAHDEADAAGKMAAPAPAAAPDKK